MPTLEVKPFDHNFRLMQRELVKILQQNVCWSDKSEVAHALSCVRRDYEKLEDERRLFESEDACEAVAVDNEQ